MPSRGQLTSVAYRVKCPVCGSPPGKRCYLIKERQKGRLCRGAGSYSYQAHPERLRAAREAVEGSSA